MWFPPSFLLDPPCCVVIVWPMDDETYELDTQDLLTLLMGLERNTATVREQGGVWPNRRLYQAHMSRALKKLLEAREHLREAVYWANDGSEATVGDDRQVELPFDSDIPF